jgi:hypothetical protein
MRLINRTLNSGHAVFGLIVLLVVLKMVYPTSSRLSFEPSKSVVDDLVSDSMRTVNASLPHILYQRIEDSVRRKFTLDNRNTIWTGEGFSIAHFGAVVFKDDTTKAYYFNVPGYFPEEVVSFYAKDGKSYLEYNVWTQVDEAAGTATGYPVEKETSVRYVPGEEKTWTVGFPISSSTYQVLRLITIALMAVGVLLALYIYLNLALRVLLLIAKGQAFSDEVIGSLYTIAWYLIGTSLLFMLARLGLHILLRSKVSFPFTFYYYDDVMSASSWMVGGLVVLLLAQAFRNGAQLQKEQELTI